MRCSPRRRSPTARSLTQRPPSRLTSSVWKRLHRRSRWSGPPQTAPPHGSPTEAGDEADDEAAAAASGGGEATQRHNTLLTIGREAGAPDAGLRATGRLPERGEARRLYPDGERGLREAGRLEGGAASGSPAPRPAEARTRYTAAQSQAGMAAPGSMRRRGHHAGSESIQTGRGGDWLTLGTRQAGGPVSSSHSEELLRLQRLGERLCAERS